MCRNVNVIKLVRFKPQTTAGAQAPAVVWGLGNRNTCSSAVTWASEAGRHARLILRIQRLPSLPIAACSSSSSRVFISSPPR